MTTMTTTTTTTTTTTITAITFRRQCCGGVPFAFAFWTY
jgi:hypothetical protein